MRFYVFVIMMLFFVGCGEIRPIWHEGNNQENYKKIFKEEVPENVMVVNSVYCSYSGYRIGVVTTPDWEIELIAPQKWIDITIDDMHLRNVNDGWERFDDIIKRRVENRWRGWYVPKDINCYYRYYLYPTSIPYVHMLIDKEIVENGRYRVFMSKH
ncbi:MAG: hypothetical protein JEZ07_00845 [Phycisphaerae bacterium]|nr:hypothetical protein [Phycisphaerae bacterium]